MPVENTCISGVDGGLGIIRGYLTSAGGVRQLLSKTNLFNSKSLLAKPRARLFFSSQAPKKRSKWRLIYLFIFKMLFWFYILMFLFFVG